MNAHMNVHIMYFHMLDAGYHWLVQSVTVLPARARTLPRALRHIKNDIMHHAGQEFELVGFAAH